MIEKAGTYTARASEVMLGTSKEKGTPFVGVMFTVTGGEYAGQKVKWEGWLTERTAERTIESLQHCGWTGDDLSELTKGLQGLDQNEVELVVEMEPYDGPDDAKRGKSYPKVKWVNRAGSGPRFAGEAMNVAQVAAFGKQFRGLAMALKAKSGQKPAAKPAASSGPALDLRRDDDIPF